MGKSSVRYRKTTSVVATEVAVIGCTMFQNSRNSTVHSGACLPVAGRLLGERWGEGAILTYFWEAEGTTVIYFCAAGGSRWIAGP